MVELNERFRTLLQEKGINLKESEAKVSFTVSDMPLEWFVRFKSNAKERFGDCYWCYIMHLMNLEENSMSKEDYKSLVSEIQRLKERVTALEGKKEDKKSSEPKTLGGGE